MRAALLVALIASLANCEKAPATPPSPSREPQHSPESPEQKWWCFRVQDPVIPLGACLETKAGCDTQLAELLQVAPKVVTTGCKHQPEVACAEGGRSGSTWTKCVSSMELCKEMYSDSTKERPILKPCTLTR